MNTNVCIALLTFRRHVSFSTFGRIFVTESGKRSKGDFSRLVPHAFRFSVVRSVATAIPYVKALITPRVHVAIALNGAVCVHIESVKGCNLPIYFAYEHNIYEYFEE
jgi:hypothetical protein